jgi:menaquinone-dependent protoporphyrinogen oxidase
MKILIVYMSKHGTTQKAVKHLQHLLYGHDMTIVNLEYEEVENLEEYTHIMIGGSIHLGFVQAKITGFCRKNLDTLLKKHVGLFLCCMDKDNIDHLFENSFPSELVQHAIIKKRFGGELLPGKMNFFTRFLAKRFGGVKKDVHQLDINSINEFVRKMTGYKPADDKKAPLHFLVA